VLKDQVQAIHCALTDTRARGLDVPVDDAILFRTLVLLGRALAQMADEAIRPAGLAEAEFRVLAQLFSRPEGVGHPGELCAAADQSPANITRITDTLVARNLISRVASEEDRRRTILRVTPAGEALVRQLVPEAFRTIGKLFTALTPVAREQLRSHLGEIVAAFDHLAAGKSP